MLNQNGGYVVFGVTPQGHLRGQQVGDGTLEKVSAEIQRIQPQTFPVIRRVRMESDREVVVIGVSRGPARPYLYRGTAYRRVANTTVAMSADEYHRMLLERLHSNRRWETEPAEGWSVNDLDEEEIRRTVELAVQRGRLEAPETLDPTELLRGLRLLRGNVVLRAAAVLFGNTEQIEFDLPQCLLRVGRFRGTDRTVILDNRQFHGNAFVLLRAAERFLRETLPISARFEENNFERVDEPLFPVLATREALANALCHRDYSIGGGSVGVAVYDDRLEVTSSGRLPFGLTPEDLFGPHDSKPWNPLIARAFYFRGIVEEWGRGTLRMLQLTADAGLPRPEIEDDGGSVTVRFRRGGRIPTGQGVSELTERQQAILALLQRSGRSLKRREISSMLGARVGERQLTRDLDDLREKGFAVTTGRGPKTRWKRSYAA